MVGSANGRSMITSTSRLPGKSSRTSTQAISRPNTRLTTLTPAEMVNVTRNESTAACEVVANQNARQPPPADCQPIAASGASTISDSHTTAAPTRSETLSRSELGRPASAPAGRAISEVSAVVIRLPGCRSW